jgi:hypothetical protein
MEGNHEEANMRRRLLILLLLVVAASSPAQLDERQLQRETDEGLVLGWLEPERAVADYYSWVYYSPLATTFTAPLDCRLLAYRVYWKGGGQWAGQETIPFTALLYEDEAGRPTGPTRIAVYTSIPGAGGWYTIDVADRGIEFAEDEVFHPGWTYGEYDERQQLIDPGAGTGLSTVVKNGSGSCWYTDDPQGSPSWCDSDQNYIHLVEVVVEPLD